MSVTGDSADPIPHGLRGSRSPWNCKCDICLPASREYNRAKQAESRDRQRARRADEVAAKRRQRRGGAATESVDSQRKRVGRMERAVIEECAQIPDAKPTLVIVAEELARVVDSLSGNVKAIALANNSMKQLVAVMADMRGDTDKAKATGRRKSGGRLATVGALTKVKRAQ